MKNVNLDKSDYFSWLEVCNSYTHKYTQELKNKLREHKFSIIKQENNYDVFAVRVSLKNFTAQQKNQIFSLLNIKKLDCFSKGESFQWLLSTYIFNNYFDQLERLDGWYNKSSEELYLIIKIYGDPEDIRMQVYNDLIELGHFTVSAHYLTFINSKALIYRLDNFYVSKDINFEFFLLIINNVLSIKLSGLKISLSYHPSLLKSILLKDFEVKIGELEREWEALCIRLSQENIVPLYWDQDSSWKNARRLECISKFTILRNFTRSQLLEIFS